MSKNFDRGAVMLGILNRYSFQLGLVALLIVSGTAMAVEKPTTVQTTCVTAECHASYKAQAFVHGPVGLGDCKSCHDSNDPAEHTYNMTRPGRDLCEYCHLDQAEKSIVHEPVAKGDCLLCHDPHSSDTKFLMRKDSVAQQCAECHKVTEGKKHLHGPTAMGECSICHEAHSSERKGLLTMKSTELCVACHVVTQEEIAKFEFVHEPAQGDCSGCHDPHGAETTKMLKGNTPDLCYTCHEEVQATAENSKHKHGVVLEAGGCLKCHTPHASTVRYLMKDNPATLCLNCHSEPLAVSPEEVLPSFTSEIENKKYLHGPVQEKTCSGCHVAHGSENPRLLQKAYPELFYASYSPENYALCFGCHPESIVEDANTVDLTDFRNGTMNLHYLHVNKAERGRTCRACHETHGSNLPKHLRESVPYGMWEMPLGFTKTDTGGSCSSGCHAPKTYNRIQPVDYTLSQELPVQEPVKEEVVNE
jgi:predicted CXXCH cytochrome family protein